MSNTTSLSLSQTRPASLVTAVGLMVFRSLMTIPSFFIPTPDDVEVPIFVIVESVVVSIVVLFLCWRIWNGSKTAAKWAIGLTAIDVLLTLPAFGTGVGTAIIILAAIGVITGIAAIVLMRIKSSWSTLR